MAPTGNQYTENPKPTPHANSLGSTSTAKADVDA